MLSWTPPEDDGGSAILRYEYRQSTDTCNTSSDNVSIPDSAPGGANATSYTVRGLDPNTRYCYLLYAVNSVGTGAEARISGSATPLPLTLPGQPRNFTATPASRSMVLAWTAPEDDGGTPILYYEYTVVDNSLNMLVNNAEIPNSGPGGANATSFTVEGLDPSKAYRLSVAAVNSVGPGPIATTDNFIAPQAAESDPLTAAFEAMPETHDGSAKPYKNGCRCPDCGRRGRIVHQTTEPPLPSLLTGFKRAFPRVFAYLKAQRLLLNRRSSLVENGLLAAITFDTAAIRAPHGHEKRFSR